MEVTSALYEWDNLSTLEWDGIPSDWTDISPDFDFGDPLLQSHDETIPQSFEKPADALVTDYDAEYEKIFNGCNSLQHQDSFASSSICDFVEESLLLNIPDENIPDLGTRIANEKAAQVPTYDAVSEARLQETYQCFFKENSESESEGLLFLRKSCEKRRRLSAAIAKNVLLSKGKEQASIPNHSKSNAIGTNQAFSSSHMDLPQFNAFKTKLTPAQIAKDVPLFKMPIARTAPKVRMSPIYPQFHLMPIDNTTTLASIYAEYKYGYQGQLPLEGMEKKREFQPKRRQFNWRYSDRALEGEILRRRAICDAVIYGTISKGLSPETALEMLERERRSMRTRTIRNFAEGIQDGRIKLDIVYDLKRIRV